MSVREKMNNWDFRSGVYAGMWNANNPHNPDWPTRDGKNERLKLEGYNYGYNNPEEARKELDDYNESVEWS